MAYWKIESTSYAKSNSKKLALIAAANKLLKQTLAIAKPGLYYDENFISVYINIGWRSLDFSTVHW